MIDAMLLVYYVIDGS